MARKHHPPRSRDHRGPRQDRERREAPVLRKPGGLDQLEGRNPVLECLLRKRRRVHRLLLDERARPNPKLDRLISSAKDQGVTVTPVPRDDLDAISETGVHNGVIAWVAALDGGAQTLENIVGVFASSIEFLSLLREYGVLGENEGLRANLSNAAPDQRQPMATRIPWVVAGRDESY